jgi:hypothetical protein
VAIPSTATNANLYSSTRSIICRQRATDCMYSLFWNNKPCRAVMQHAIQFPLQSPHILTWLQTYQFHSKYKLNSGGANLHFSLVLLLWLCQYLQENALLSGFQAWFYTMKSSITFWSIVMLPHSRLNLVLVDAEALGTQKCVHYNNFCENKLQSKLMWLKVIIYSI